MTFIGIITLNLLYWQFIISSKRSKFSEQNTDYLTARHLLSCCVYVTSSLASLIRMSTRKTARRFGFWVYQDGRRRLPLPRSCILFSFFFLGFLHHCISCYSCISCRWISRAVTDFFFLNRKKLELIYFYDCYFCFFLSAFSVSFISRPCVVACKLVCSRVCSCVTLNLFAYVMFPPPGNY